MRMKFKLLNDMTVDVMIEVDSGVMCQNMSVRNLIQNAATRGRLANLPRLTDQRGLNERKAK